MPKFNIKDTVYCYLGGPIEKEGYIINMQKSDSGKYWYYVDFGHPVDEKIWIVEWELRRS